MKEKENLKDGIDLGRFDVKSKRAGCVKLVSMDGEEIHVCLAPRKNLGGKGYIIGTKDEVKKFNTTDSVVEFLTKDCNVPFEEVKKVIELSESMESARTAYDGYEFKLGPVKFKKERFRGSP